MPRSGLVLFLSIALLFSFCSNGLSRTWHVTVDGGGDAPTIQAAIDSAGMDDTLLVGPGTYTWTNQGSGNEYGMIHIMRGAPALVIVSEMGPEHTILDAQHQNRVFFYQGYYPGTPGGLTIDGFTFTHGLTTQPNNDIGGGFTAHLSSPILRNCVFRYNSADRGGAVWFGGQGSPQFVDCVFEANTSRVAGAMYVINTPFTVFVTRCVFRNNEASAQGGAIFGYNVPLAADRCVFARNIAGADGGTLHLWNCLSSSVSRSTLYFNRGSAGGGVSLAGSTALAMDRCIIAASEDGGAASVGGTAALTFSCSDLHGNVGGDWTGSIAGQYGVNGNFSSDPSFCNTAAFDLTLQADSPCAPGNHPDGTDCGLIGALQTACGGVAVEKRSWGAIKSLYAD